MTTTGDGAVESVAGGRVLHVITPGDHYSPRTGSATVSVVHGLSAARPAGTPQPIVAVEEGTYPDRYASASIIEYPHRAWGRRDRYIDAGLARLGLPRARARARYRSALDGQETWGPLAVVGHNAVQLVPEVDRRRHRAVLYAHNDLLNSYSGGEVSRTLRDVDAIIAVSRFLADRIASRLPIPMRRRVTAIPNGVDLDLFRPADTRSDPGLLRVTYVGRVVPDKGADVLVDAVVRLARDDVELTVIGSQGFDPSQPHTPFERELRERAAGARGRIRFLPFQPRAELAGLLAMSDVVAVPSRWPEPFALTVLEGMASGAAVIASDIGGIPEAAGGAAILVPPGEVGPLVGAIEAFASDGGLLDRHRAAGLEHARASSWEKASADFYGVIRSLEA